MAEIRSALKEVKRRREHSLFRQWKLLATAAVVIVALITGVLYWGSRKASALGEKDTLVLADFQNTTGEVVFDGALRQGLSLQLEQSPYLNLLSDTAIAGTLALMAQPKDARLTHELARQVCERNASAATIEGSIDKLGNQYVLGLKVVNCRTGDLLAEEQATVSGKEQVIAALGEAATKLRKKLGESPASVQKYDAKSYKDFFALWKDADPDIPILHAAKAEYAQLK